MILNTVVVIMTVNAAVTLQVHSKVCTCIVKERQIKPTKIELCS